MTWARILTYVVLFGAAATAHADQSDYTNRRSSGVRLGGRWLYDTAGFRNPNSDRATFSGSGFGGTLETRYKSKRYSAGVVFGYDQVKLNNTANNSVNSETLDTTHISLVPRLYALDLYFGVGVLLEQIDYSATNSGVSTKDKYTGYGLRLELGYDWYLGRKFYVAPMLYYTITKVRPDSTAGSTSLNVFGITLGLGYDF